VINDLNVVMSGVTYPGRVSTTATADDIEF
jgi:hypothetical protein